MCIINTKHVHFHMHPVSEHIGPAVKHWDCAYHHGGGQDQKQLHTGTAFEDIQMRSQSKHHNKTGAAVLSVIDTDLQLRELVCNELY